jgi:hypothetical protein
MNLDLSRDNNNALTLDTVCSKALRENSPSRRPVDNVSTVPCSNGYCCPAGDNCVPDGCCSAGEQQCGSSKCYNPETEICCGDSGTCPKVEDCVVGGCCPSGQIPCGSNKCYNPESQQCCQKGSQVWACPASASCCDVGYCYYPDSERCCPGGSCPKEDTCCTKQCCRSVAYCGGDGYCSMKATPTPTLSTSTSISSSSTTSARVSVCALSPKKLSRDVPESGDGGPKLSKRRHPFPKTCVQECGSDGSQMALWEIIPIAGETDQLIWSMCKGWATSFSLAVCRSA